MAIPIKNGGSFHSYGTLYQRITITNTMTNHHQPWFPIETISFYAKVPPTFHQNHGHLFGHPPFDTGHGILPRFLLGRHPAPRTLSHSRGCGIIFQSVLRTDIVIYIYIYIYICVMMCIYIYIYTCDMYHI